MLSNFKNLLQQGKNIAIISDAGCPAIADPGEILVAAAQQLNATVKPLVGPNSIILALMASGMNGNCFQFHGYLPIDSLERKNKIKALELDSQKRKCAQIFIENIFILFGASLSVLRACVNCSVLLPYAIPELYVKLSIYVILFLKYVSVSIFLTGYITDMQPHKVADNV